jgi:membrane fusion protein (multidrug efflux system)
MILSARPKEAVTNARGAVAVLVLAAALPSGAARGAPKSPLTVASNLMVDQEVAVTTRVSGVVESIDADRGETVKKGQPLATLDQREFKLDFRAAEETFNVSASDLKRYEELFRLSLCSQAELEQKRSRLELTRVELERARLVIDRSVVRAPFDGVVADRFVRVGEKVLLDEHKPLFRVMALEPLLARAYLPAVALGSVKVGDEVAVVATDFPESRSSGRVTFVSPVVDPASGTVQVIVKVQQDVRKVMRPGLAVKLTFETAAGAAAPSAPAR